MVSAGMQRVCSRSGEIGVNCGVCENVKGVFSEWQKWSKLWCLRECRGRIFGVVEVE